MPAARSSFSPRDAGLLVGLALLWGNSFLFIKTAVAEVPPGWVVAGRLTIGGALLVGIVGLGLLRGGENGLPRGRRAIVALGLIGVAGTAAGWYGQAWAQQSLDSGLVAVLNATTPAATLVLALMARIERLYLMRVIGLSVAISGSVVIIGGEVSAGGPLVALVVAAVAPFAYGLGSVITRREISGKVATLPAVATQLVIGAIVMTMVSAAVEGPPPLPGDLSPIPLLALGLLGLLGTGVAFIIYFTLIANVGATNASMVTYLVPIVGLISGAVFRGERFGLNVFIGAAILVVGVYLAQRRPADGSDGAPGDGSEEDVAPLPLGGAGAVSGLRR